MTIQIQTDIPLTIRDVCKAYSLIAEERGDGEGGVVLALVAEKIDKALEEEKTVDWNSIGKESLQVAELRRKLQD